MRAGWGMSNYSHCFSFDAKYFIYVCVRSEIPSYVVVCKVR